MEGIKLRGQDSNLRPRGYEPRELPGCSTPRYGTSPEVMRCRILKEIAPTSRGVERFATKIFIRLNLATIRNDSGTLGENNPTKPKRTP